MRHAPGFSHQHTMPRLALTPKCVLCGAQRDTSWLRAEGIKGVRQRDGNAKNQERERGLFWPNSHSSLSSSLYLHATHIVSRNTISCLKQEVKNNISHGNLGSGESCLTGMADYWCIFNKVKDLQWCMWLPFQNGRPCHLFGPAISRDVSNGEADWKSAENRTGLER